MELRLICCVGWSGVNCPLKGFMDIPRLSITFQLRKSCGVSLTVSLQVYVPSPLEEQDAELGFILSVLLPVSTVNIIGGGVAVTKGATGVGDGVGVAVTKGATGVEVGDACTLLLLPIPPHADKMRSRMQHKNPILTGE